ncbi:SRPBCC domain-containing protein [Bradyrhizobium sp. 2TAF36]|uniref:SRPBCC domain-containing protein n=1 Tax=Bradyrhizobium sp. 2TAF36 TaxID=3233016 RepID=UPI003F8E2C17
MNDTDRTHASSRLISANSACIYDACIQSEKLMRWIAPAGAVANVEKCEAREGGCFKIILSFNNDIGKSSSRTDVVSGRFLRLVPDGSIVQAIDFVSDRPEFAGTMIMSWFLHPWGEKTLVSVVAENVPQGISRADHELGMASSLENLAEFVETVCGR